MANNQTQSNTKLVTAHARHLHIGPRKMRLVTNLIKNMNVADAMTQLQHLEKKASPMLVKLLNSAIANATHNFSLDPKFLYIKSITTDGGKVMKRFFPRARGSAFAIHRRMSHVNIILEERKTGKASKIRLPFLKKKEEVTPTNIDQKIETNIKPTNQEQKKPQLFRSEEQTKMSKVQNKRRLFNRKSGE